jgi:ABC-type transporter Mla MlaB component
MIVLASNCNVKDAAELKQTLCVHLDDAEPVTVDVGSVERVDTSTMQVLCAFVRDRSAQERKVEWLGDASVVRDAARLLGVEPMLCLPTAEVTR